MPTDRSLADRVREGDRRAVARAISIVEQADEGGRALIQAIHAATGRAFVVGVTGAPGTGKSTLVDRLVTTVRRGGMTTGVLAVDPSSPFTGGAILADRVRMPSHEGDAGVFIRSMATRGHLGGLARATADAVLVLDAAGFDVIIIETVGVGQDEVDIVSTADVSIVVLVPGAGDDLQAIKAGIMEIADIFVVNKADREGADGVVGAVAASLSLRSVEPDDWTPPVLKTQAISGGGVDELWDEILRFRQWSAPRTTARRLIRETRYLRTLVSAMCLERVEAALPAGEFERLAAAVATRTLDPYSAVAEIVARVLPGPPARAGTQMKPTLDHIGIAVRDVAEALAFYQEALGLEAGHPEVVETERVRVQTLALGGPTLELLEATDPESAVGRFVARRGPGLHHITFRVEDIRAAMARLTSRGVRLVTEEPRRGAGGALVVFVHPQSAHGVLVELTEKAVPPLALNVGSLSLGDMRLTTLHDGGFRLDGGAMFGVVPRTLWEKVAPPDERHRIQLAMRPLLVEAPWGRLLVDCGAGDKMTPKQQDIYALDRTRHLDHALAAGGTGPDSIDLVLATHLHFDHFGGATARVDDALRPRFPNARYLIRTAEWEDATHPHARNRASYLADDFVPLQAAGVVDFLAGDGEVRPGVRIERTGGHTGQHQIVYLESGGRTAVFVADMIPTTAHLQDPWVMGYDLFPLETLAFKQRFVREAIDREYLIFFEHDPLVAAGYIRERDGTRYVEPVL